MRHRVTITWSLSCVLIAFGLLGLEGCRSTKEMPPPAAQDTDQTMNQTAQSEVIRNSTAGDGSRRGQTISSSSTPGGDVQVSQAPGQYDVMEGTVLQLRAQNSEKNPDVKGYRWEIVEGSGGKLLNADTAEVTFYASNIISDTEAFTLKLTTEFANGKSSSASMIVRVHKRAPQSSGTTSTVQRRYGINPWFTGALGFGLGYLWNYPVYVPFYVPVPGEDFLPEDLPATTPEPLTRQEIQELPSDLRPETVLPETVEFPDAIPLEPGSGQTQLGTESPAIETPPEVESGAPSIGIEPVLENTPESSLPPDTAPSMQTPSIEAPPVEAMEAPAPDITPPMDMPMPTMDIPMDAGEY